MKILVYFLHNPWPPRSGAHQRCLQILRELRAAGHEVVFSSSALHSEQPWNDESKKAVSEITGHQVYFYGGAGPVNRKINAVEKRIRSVRDKNEFRDSVFCPYSLVRWFRRLVAEIKPDAILINYAWFDQLVDHKKWNKIHLAIELHDLVSLNTQMREFVNGQLTAYSQKPDASKFREDFIAARAGFRLDPREVAIYRGYENVLSISKTETDHLRSLLPGTNVVYAPFIIEPVNVENNYKGAALLSLGPNPFNTQGYLYFQDAVLPEVLKLSPGFRLTVTGSIKAELCRHPAIDCKGFVENRDELFRDAGFAVCPVFSGTGQQIKIVEAMAHGLAVVAFEEAARNSFVKHGENGLVANSPEEFARHVAGLQNDVALRARLGQSARLTIRQEWKSSGGLRAFARGLGNGAAI